MQHDTIIESSNPDYVLVEAEANRVAKDALKALKVSRQQCRLTFNRPPPPPPARYTGLTLTLQSSTYLISRKIISVFPYLLSQETVWTKEEFSPECIFRSVCPHLRQMQGNSSVMIWCKMQHSHGRHFTFVTPWCKIHLSLSLQDAAIIKKSMSKKPGSGAHFSGEGPESESGSTSLSSSSLLAQMRVRNYLSVPSSQREEAEEEENDSGAPESATSPAVATEHDELLVDLRNFVAFQANVDGQATTQEVLEYFKPRLTQQQAPVFRELLRSICDFHRTSGQEGIWRLKEHFRWVMARLNCNA